MRLRTLFTITLTMFALPALANAQRESPTSAPVSADSLVAIANVQAETACDEKTPPANRDALLDSARKGYQKALQQDPKSKAAMLGLARLYSRTNEREKAVEMYKKCLAQHHEAEIAHEVATAHARWKDWPEAVAWCDYALKIDPENRVAKKTKGFCQAFAGQWDAAFATLCEIMPEANARYNLAGLLHQMGQADKCKLQLQLSLKADPNYAPAQDMLRKLDPVEATATRLMPPPRPGGIAVVDAAGCPDFSVVFEVRTLKVPVGFCERAGVKLTGNTVLGEDDLRRLVEAAQALPDASVKQFPKVTAEDGQTATVRNCEERLFVTGMDAKRVKGATVLVPKNTPVELGDTLTVCGKVSRDAQTVTVKVSLKCVRVAGEVELIPVMTKITPVFEGGSQGQPVPFTQYIQSPDVRTESVEKHVILTSGHTIVLGSWKETAEPAEQPARNKLFPRKAKPAAEYEVVSFATARVFRWEEPAVAPMPHEAYNPRPRSYVLRNVAAADAAAALTKHLEGENRKVRFAFDAATNMVFVSGDSAVVKRVFDLLAALDKAPPQVMIQAMVVQVPRGFMEASGLTAGGEPAKATVLSQREARMLTALFRAAREKGEIDVLSRPQLQVADNQTGFVQVGQNFPVQTVGLVKTEGGAVVEAKIEFVPTGLTMRVTPRFSPDGKSILLKTEGQLTTVSPTPVVLGNPEDPKAPRAPVFNTQRVSATAEVRAGETVIFAMVGGETGGRSFLGEIRRHYAAEKFETLVIMTPMNVTAPEPPRPAPVGR